MDEGLKGLGPKRKPTLEVLRNFESGRGNAGTVDTQLGQLSDRELGDLAKFVEIGGWRGILKEGTLRVLGERISARRGVSAAYAKGDAESPIANVAPQQEVAPVIRRANPSTPTAQATQERPAERVIAATSVQAAQATQAAQRIHPAQPTGLRVTDVGAERTRREPLSAPRGQVSRSSTRPPEGRGPRW
jgi:hypothetical protein